jgi:hypothetical protein
MGTRLTPPTSGLGLRSPLPHLHRDSACPCHICIGIGAPPSSLSFFGAGVGLGVGVGSAARRKRPTLLLSFFSLLSCLLSAFFAATSSFSNRAISCSAFTLPSTDFAAFRASWPKAQRYSPRRPRDRARPNARQSARNAPHSGVVREGRHLSPLRRVRPPTFSPWRPSAPLPPTQRRTCRASGSRSRSGANTTTDAWRRGGPRRNAERGDVQR